MWISSSLLCIPFCPQHIFKAYCICTWCSVLCHSTPNKFISGLIMFVDLLLSSSTDDLSTPWSLSLQYCSFFSLSCAACIIIFHFSSLSVAIAPGSVLDETKAGFPAFSGIARLTWLIDLFGDLTITSASREEQKDKNYSRMTVHFQTANKK